MACVSNALIVGGGIAGLSAALALARIGVHCEVLEIADAPLGASLGLTGRATQALDELGVYDDCRASARVFMPGETLTSLHDAAGNLLSPAPTRPSLPGIKDGLGVYRPVFLDVLTQHARRHGVVIRRGVTAEAIDNAADVATVTLTGGERRRYDRARTVSVRAPAVWYFPTRRRRPMPGMSASVGWRQGRRSPTRPSIAGR